MWAFWGIARVDELDKRDFVRYLHQNLGTCVLFFPQLSTLRFLCLKNTMLLSSLVKPEEHAGGRLHIETSSRVWFPVPDFLFFGFNGFGVVAYKWTLTLLTWDLFWTLHARSSNSDPCFKVLSWNWPYCCCPTTMYASILWVTSQRKRTVHPWKWRVQQNIILTGN